MEIRWSHKQIAIGDLITEEPKKRYWRIGELWGCDYIDNERKIEIDFPIFDRGQVQCASRCNDDGAWSGSVLNDLHVKQSATIIAKDNNGAIEWAEESPAKHFARRNHIDIKTSYVMEEIQLKDIKLRTFEDKDMLADFLTKPLARKHFDIALSHAKIFNMSLHINYGT